MWAPVICRPPPGYGFERSVSFCFGRPRFRFPSRVDGGAESVVSSRRTGVSRRIGSSLFFENSTASPSLGCTRRISHGSWCMW